MARHENAHDRSIRLRARRMWREAGSPEGREDEYIERARELQAFVEHPAAGLLPNPMLAHPHPEDAIEEAELMDNLGEFPVRTDQGDRITTPMTKQRAREFLRRR
jgi:Protein of unknown function (DUF2934)